MVTHKSMLEEAEKAVQIVGKEIKIDNLTKALIVP
jgi:hypothetical protein